MICLVTVDVGKTMLRNPRTYDVYVDKDGNMIDVERLELVKQVCEVAMSTVKGEVPLDTEYGFPLNDMLLNIQSMDPHTLIKTSVLECLNRQNIPEIFEADVIGVKKNEDESGIYDVAIQVETINGDIIQLGMEVPIEL